MSNKEEKLEKENSELKKQLWHYKELEEELMAKRVFEKARKKLVQWYTVGGITLFIVGVIGIKSIVDYSKEIAQKKLEKITTDKVNSILQNEAKNQVTTLLISKQTIIEEQFETLTKQKIAEINISTSPLTTVNRAKDSINISGEILKSIDLSSKYGAIENQGYEGSVVCFAIASAMDFIINQNENKTIKLSRRYFYNSLNNGTNSGLYVKDALNFVTENGLIEDKYWTYQTGEYDVKPKEEFGDLEHYKIKDWKRLTELSLEEMKIRLSKKEAIFIALVVYESYYNADNGIILLKDNETPIGGHLVNIVGYDDSSKLIKIKNSWGVDWGDKGYGYLRYDDWNKIVKEGYTIK